MDSFFTTEEEGEITSLKFKTVKELKEVVLMKLEMIVDYKNKKTFENALMGVILCA